MPTLCRCGVLQPGDLLQCLFKSQSHAWQQSTYFQQFCCCTACRGARMAYMSTPYLPPLGQLLLPPRLQVPVQDLLPGCHSILPSSQLLYRAMCGALEALHCRSRAQLVRCFLQSTGIARATFPQRQARLAVPLQNARLLRVHAAAAQMASTSTQAIQSRRSSARCRLHTPSIAQVGLFLR
jgi:hypothetical protein